MEFNLSEKLAIVYLIDSLIIADGKVHKGEINILSKLMKVLDFDSNFLIQARNLETEYSIDMLKGISYEKKKKLIALLQDVAMSDGFVHEKENRLLQHVSSAIGLGAQDKNNSL